MIWGAAQPVRDVLVEHGQTIAVVAVVLAIMLVLVIVLRGRRGAGGGAGSGLRRRNTPFHEFDDAMNAGDFAEAAAVARRMKDPRRYADAIEASGDVERAVQAWTDAGEPLKAAALLAANGHDTKAGRLYLDAGATREALACFIRADDLEGAARVVERQGDHKKAALMRGEAMLRKESWAEAAKFFEESGDLGRAAAALTSGGDSPAAIALYQRAGQPILAAKLLEASAPAKAAALYAEAGNTNDAVRVYRGIGDQAAAERVLASTGRPFDAGRAAFERRDFDGAMKLLSGIEPAAQNYREAQLIRGYILERRSDLDSAAAAYNAFLDGRTPNERNRALFIRVAHLKEGCGQLQTALKLLGRLIAAGFGTPDVTAHAARLEQSIGKAPPTEGYAVPPAEPKRTAGRSFGRGADAAKEGSAPGQPRKITPLAGILSAQTAAAVVDPPAVQVLERRYRFMGRLGQGGNGVVYRATDRALGRNVVVKFLHQALLPTEIARKYFEREAKTAASLTHPNIVTIFDVGEEGETLYFSMELVEGRTLADIIVDAGGKLAHDRVVPIATQLCSALEYAHSKNVIHRDIKPGNIMVTEAGTLKLLDFGLAKALDENPDNSVFLCGTPFYMSPEQIRRDFLDHRTDIYSLGCLLYVLYTGDVPFPDGNVFFHQQNTPPPDPDTLVTGLPKGVAQVLLKCVAKDRGDRYQRAGEVADALARIASGPPREVNTAA
ncbi:MAG: serine/threonine protein kinase [Myxococcales bacterium]|nr:serine/threonine protein kinase [Myxococcales bacterium]